MTIECANPGSKPTPGVGAKIFISFFFLFFLGMGSAFVWLVAREAVAGLKTWTWRPTPCDIVRSGVGDADKRGRRAGDFYLDVEYRYNFGGRLFVSDHPTLKRARVSDYGKVERLAEKYPAGGKATCYVNPADPGQAVLEQGSLVFPFLVFFPLIFVAIGVGGIYSAWRSPSLRPAEARPISERAGGALAARVPVLFFGVFMFVGLLMFVILSVRPLSRILSARSWPTIQCTILSSEFRSYRGNHGNTYSVNILYSYTFNGRQYEANRYDFMGGSSSGYNGKRAIVSRFPPGSTTVCYVDPSDPTEAVMVRGFTPVMWIGLLPLAFFMLGLFGLVSAISKNRTRAQPSTGADVQPWIGTSAEPQTGQFAGSSAPANLALRPGSSPWTKFIGALVFSLFWNGIISVFVVHLFKGWRSGYFEWFLALFLIPFVLLGLVLILAIGYFFLALFNPRPHLRVTPAAPRLGESLKIEWDLKGRVDALQNLRVKVEGREEATYARGTRTATDRNVFARLDVAALTNPQEMRSGGGSVTIPAALMHSFTARHNKIIWSIRLEGEIPRWPDLNEEFALTVLPSTCQPHTGYD